ncbi:hypothetical protein BgiBS90_028600 [Biomphalaria glabrata]|nr:hypothetical protein BgiMline_016137 [Biomphalaria glabrata]KAI8770714.1 hypothetical protein BgiBS90_028600 [Biomphalaria glabrata]
MVTISANNFVMQAVDFNWTILLPLGCMSHGFTSLRHSQGRVEVSEYNTGPDFGQTGANAVLAVWRWTQCSCHSCSLSRSEPREKVKVDQFIPLAQQRRQQKEQGPALSITGGRGEDPKS